MVRMLDLVRASIALIFHFRVDCSQRNRVQIHSFWVISVTISDPTASWAGEVDSVFTASPSTARSQTLRSLLNCQLLSRQALGPAPGNSTSNRMGIWTLYLAQNQANRR